MDLLRFALLSALLVAFSTAYPGKWNGCHVEELPPSWILEFRSNVSDNALSNFKHHFRKRAENASVQITHEFNLGPGLMRGFTLDGPADSIMALSDSQWVANIVPNIKVHRPPPDDDDGDDDEDEDEDEDDDITEAKSIHPHLARREETYDLQKKYKSWNLEAISGNDSLKYHCPDGCGKGTWIYIIDDGIDEGHPEFKGRIEHVEHIHKGPYHHHPKRNGKHGTAMAGIAAGSTMGVARNARIVAVNVFGKDNIVYLDLFLQAMDWVMNDIRTRNRFGRAILSLGQWGCRAEGIDGAPATRAVADAVKAGVFVAAANGYKVGDTATVWPGNAKSVCTVGEYWQGRQWDGEEAGDPDIDIFAPGSRIRTSQPGSVGSYNRYHKIGGSDAAAAHVAGVAATLVHQIKLADMCETLQCWGNMAHPKWFPNTANRLLVNRPTADLDLGDQGMWDRPECQPWMNRTGRKRPSPYK
ncbi:hypothetical protein PFICI_07689 [Pestalotiopsis fici W106-1]|uniref:Peptidase S8/S53 domain-containing protein n=1 Tax=Pestalotiopsis fici (strain W106-1 / CGMCC3.15140) TaxID=1229662 RepID=W3X254_PESFW|nr:uncharacterized protein PFICI_07689 [Pestalotiopsis fici W106-1]ETS80160.1 hypothetical protein PFICI_07689 [Pestalotiopsis fici W106-1]